MTIDTSNIIGPDAAQALLAGAVDWTQYDGMRVASHTSAAVYLAIWGQLSWIPDEATFNSLFADWSGIVNSDYLVDNMPHASPLANDSFIGISAASPAEYLVTFGKKFHIPDQATVSRFNFRGPVSVPHLALDYIPTGQDVS